MKKIFLVTIIFLAVFICGISISSANRETGKEFGIVIISGAEFKTSDYYKIISKTFKLPNGYVIGDEMQSKYQKFLLENDLIGEKLPRKNYLLDFTAQSGCERILFLVVTSTADHQNNSKSRQKNRISVQVDAYLCDRYKILEGATSAQQNDSNTSDLRARRGSFKKCLTEIAKYIKLSA